MWLASGRHADCLKRFHSGVGGHSASCSVGYSKILGRDERAHVPVTASQTLRPGGMSGNAMAKSAAQMQRLKYNKSQVCTLNRGKASRRPFSGGVPLVGVLTPTGASPPLSTSCSRGAAAERWSAQTLPLAACTESVRGLRWARG